ncbi:hypothetical protein LX69_03189 [Breznakibacter xylanolyticus]|uniref:Uncharacterized protein n=1 Tax=Breznakibacter xylanolyticus TaxID=990 RepID=A0A2W7N343_9BACT|nr:hypothetical protein LX69_03189 [Breznakibacter xylanolyticus]
MFPVKGYFCGFNKKRRSVYYFLLRHSPQIIVVPVFGFHLKLRCELCV